MGLEVKAESEFGERHTRETESWEKKLAFVLIVFEEGCFSFLGLFYLSKKHVLVTCNKILSNITAKVISECKV